MSGNLILVGQVNVCYFTLHYILKSRDDKTIGVQESN